MGTKLVGDHLSRGTNFGGTICLWGTNLMGTICTGGQEVGDWKSKDPLVLGLNLSQLRVGGQKKPKSCQRSL